MGAVVTKYIIIPVKRGTYAGGNGLLTGAKVNRAAYLMVLDGLDKPLLAYADTQHRYIQIL